MFRSISLACAALVVAVGAGAAVAQSRGAALEVRTPGLTAEGSVVVAVFDKEADWKSRDRPVRTQKVAAGPNSRVRIDGLAPGRYGLRVFHDKNNDGRLNTWPIGMPSENKLSAGAERLSTPATICTTSSTSVTGNAMATAVRNICPANPVTSAIRSAPSQVCPGGNTA